MEYCLLNQSNIKISKICLGTEIYSRKNDVIEINKIKEIFDKAKNSGINFIDTAGCYGDHLSEKIIGKVIEKKRKNWVIATKFGNKKSNDRNISNFDLDFVKRQFDESLFNLNTDFIDIYYFHSGNNEEFFNDDLWNFLNLQVKKGKIRMLGLSIKHDLVNNNNLSQIEHAKDYNIQVVQTVYNYLNDVSEKYLFKECKDNNISIIGRMPLAKGILSGKYTSNKDFNQDDPRKLDEKLNNNFFKRILNELPHIPNDKKAKWAIDWVLSNKSIASTVTAFRNTKQLIDVI